MWLKRLDTLQRVALPISPLRRNREHLPPPCGAWVSYEWAPEGSNSPRPAAGSLSARPRPVSFFRHGASAVNCVPFSLPPVLSTSASTGQMALPGLFNKQTGNAAMNTTDGIWVPTYYRHRHRFSWVRAAGGPRVADWVAGAVLAALVLGLVALARSPQRQEAPSTAVAAEAAAKDSDTDAGRVAYTSPPSTVDK